MSRTIKGVSIAIVTSPTTTGSLNIPALKMQVNRQLEAGNAIFCGGTDDEFSVLNEQEKLSVTRTCVDEVTGRVPVMAHIGGISMRETIRLSRQIEKLGIDAVPVIVPYFVPPKQEKLTAYHNAIADALSILMLLCSIPVRVDNTIQPEAACTLASHSNIIGIRDSAGGGENLKDLLDAVRDIDGFNVFDGLDPLIHKGFVEGCSACISGFASIAPREIGAIWSRFHAGDTKESHKTQESVTGLRTDLCKVAPSPAAVKKALQLAGRDVSDGRYAINFTPKQISEIQQIIHHYNIN